MIFQRPNIPLLLTRFLALALCLFALQSAWAGLKLYQAEQLFKLKDFCGAADLLSRLSMPQSSNPEVIYLTGQGAWWQGLKTGEQRWFQTAADRFEKLTAAVPYYGRGWLYLALSRMVLQEKAVGGLSSLQWRENHSLLKKAMNLEPGSAWMQYMTSIQLLKHAEFLSNPEKREALERLKKSIALHYPNQPPYYLKPSLTVLWGKFSNFQLLKQITPETSTAYNILIEFMDRKGLWKFRDEVYPKAVAFNRRLHDQRIRLGLEQFKKGRIAESLETFQNAYWVYQESTQAKAGILMAQQVLEKLPENYREDLKIVLEEEEQDVSALLPLLGPVVLQSRDPYLKGVYAYRGGRFGDAKKWFDEIQAERADAFLKCAMAETDLKLDRSDRLGFEILSSALDEDQPDIRELILLSEVDSPYRAVALDRIKKVATRRTADIWWAWGRDFQKMTSQLDQRGRIGQEINLMPGNTFFKINLRSKANSAGVRGYLLLRLWEDRKERRIGTVYVDSADWKTFVFTARTSGGKRWLEFELLNAAPESGNPGNPSVEFKGGEVRYGKA